MNLYAITACYGADRDTALVLADDDAAALALAGQGHDPRGLGTTGTEVWLVADCTLVSELPATPAHLSWPAPVAVPEALSKLGEGPSVLDLLKGAIGPASS